MKRTTHAQQRDEARAGWRWLTRVPLGRSRAERRALDRRAERVASGRRNRAIARRFGAVFPLDGSGTVRS